MNLGKALFLAVLAAVVLTRSTFAASCDQVVVDKMMAMYNLDTSEYRIDVLSSRLRSDAVGPEEITIVPLTTKEPLGLFTVLVRVSEGGQLVESGQVRMKIRRFADVVVLADKIRTREPLSEQKLTVRRMEVTSLREKPLLSIQETLGLRARRNLRQGTILTTAAIEPIPDVQAGRELAIVYVDGLCRITTTGVALQSGMAGDYIRVKNKESGKIIMARVVDETAVAVDP